MKTNAQFKMTHSICEKGSFSCQQTVEMLSKGKAGRDLPKCQKTTFHFYLLILINILLPQACFPNRQFPSKQQKAQGKLCHPVTVREITLSSVWEVMPTLTSATQPNDIIPVDPCFFSASCDRHFALWMLAVNVFSKF